MSTAATPDLRSSINDVLNGSAGKEQYERVHNALTDGYGLPTTVVGRNGMTGVPTSAIKRKFADDPEYVKERYGNSNPFLVAAMAGRENLKLASSLLAAEQAVTGVLEVLREPMESGEIVISRATRRVTYPARFQVVGAMNPCPCGYYNHPDKECVCTPGNIQRYMNKISGPLLDRIDIHIEVVPVSYEELSDVKPAESSDEIRQRVNASRERQAQRFEKHNNIYSAVQAHNIYTKSIYKQF